MFGSATYPTVASERKKNNPTLDLESQGKLLEHWWKRLRSSHKPWPGSSWPRNPSSRQRRWVLRKPAQINSYNPNQKRKNTYFEGINKQNALQIQLGNCQGFNSLGFSNQNYTETNPRAASWVCEFCFICLNSCTWSKGGDESREHEIGLWMDSDTFPSRLARR